MLAKLYIKPAAEGEEQVDGEARLVEDFIRLGILVDRDQFGSGPELAKRMRGKRGAQDL
jgi:hypothetical protein